MGLLGGRAAVFYLLSVIRALSNISSGLRSGLLRLCDFLDSSDFESGWASVHLTLIPCPGFPLESFFTIPPVTPEIDGLKALTEH